MDCKYCGSEMKSHITTLETLYYCPECFSTTTEDTFCEHELMIYDFIILNGKSQYKKVCKKCFRILSQAISQTGIKPDHRMRLELFHEKVDERFRFEKSKIIEFREYYKSKREDIRHNIYREYISSDEWRMKRKTILSRDLNTCAICGEEANHVHHLTYAHFKKEFDFELISLCKKCHLNEYHSDEAERIIEQVKQDKAILNLPDILT